MRGSTTHAACIADSLPPSKPAPKMCLLIDSAALPQ